MCKRMQIEELRAELKQAHCDLEASQGRCKALQADRDKLSEQHSGVCTALKAIEEQLAAQVQDSKEKGGVITAQQHELVRPSHAEYHRYCCSVCMHTLQSCADIMQGPYISQDSVLIMHVVRRTS